MSELTLCMIVRDEEEMLADCLASARRAVDRMVIVDTGSRDRTRDVIRRFGAELVEHAWDDDFAAARNAGLARIEAGFVLVLDADERLTPSGSRALRAAIQDGGFDLGLLPLHDAASVDASPEAVLSGEARRGEPQLLPRLLRRTPDLRYEGIVHESIASWARSGRRSQVIDAPIVHYGAAPELRAARAKDERNRELLERRCELEPNDPTTWAYLAAERERAGDGEGALEAARRAWTNWQAGAGGEHHDPVLPATLLGQLALRFGHANEAGAAVVEALEVEEHPNLHLLAGVAHEQTVVERGVTALTSAAEHYQRCLELAGARYASEVMAGATSWQAATRLGTVRLLEGRPDLARENFEQALAERDDWLEAALGLVEATLDGGEADRALGMLEPLLHVPGPDAWLLAARGALKLGSLRDARLLLERAQQAAQEQTFTAPHRYRALSALEQELLAGENDASRSNEVCAFAWPCYDEPEDLATLLGEFGKLLADAPELVLCLRHDPAVDCDIATAEARLERAFADHLGESSTLQVILVDDQHRATDLAAPRDIAIELPHSKGVRRRFLEELGARWVTSREELSRALAGPRE